MSRRVHQPQREEDPYDLHGGPEKWRWHTPTAYMFLEAWEQVGLLGLRGEEYRLLCGLVKHCGWNNRCDTTLAQVGRSVGLTGSQSSRAIKRLVTARLVYCARQRRGQAYAVTLSPELCWKGRPWHLARARESFRAQWRFHHRSRLAQPAGDEEPSPRGDGTSAAGKAPSFPQHTNGAVSSP